MITDQQLQACAAFLNVEVEAIKAVRQKESSGSGFLSTGEPAILFEPHVFWKELLKAGMDPLQVLKDHPDASDILYPKWGSKPYGPSSAQHARLNRAVAIHREAALSSASWGAFQIMGYNWKLCGCSSLQDFINKMYESEYEHLMAFAHYIKAECLDVELRNHDWAGFARSYNGPMYFKQHYDTDIASIYSHLKQAA